MAEKMSDIFSYEDALKALGEIVSALQDARNQYRNEKTGVFTNYDAWHSLNGDLCLLKALVKDMSQEQTVSDLLRNASEREDRA